MAYSQFTSLSEVLTRFHLMARYDGDLFPASPVVLPGDVFRGVLTEYAPLALSIGTKKARSEFLIAPILAEVRRLTGHKISLFSGVDFNVDVALGLVGYCDYLLSRSPDPFEIEAPVLAVVEAKKEDVPGGLGQCAAEMVAATLFNQQKGQFLTALYGAVTTGEVWRFLRLEGTVLFVDSQTRFLQPVEALLGILHQIMTT